MPSNTKRARANNELDDGGAKLIREALGIKTDHVASHCFSNAAGDCLRTEAPNRSLMTEPTNATPKEKRWPMAPRGLRPLQEAVIVAVLGLLIGTIAVVMLYFTG